MGPEGTGFRPAEKRELSLKQKLARLAAAAGIIGAATPTLGGCVNNEQKSTNPPSKITESATALTSGAEVQEAIDATKKAAEQEAAEAQDKKEIAEKAAAEKEKYEELTAPKNNIPPTSTDGLEPQGD